jgi:hypothetical protein
MSRSPGSVRRGGLAPRPEELRLLLQLGPHSLIAEQEFSAFSTPANRRQYHVDRSWAGYIINMFGFKVFGKDNEAKDGSGTRYRTEIVALQMRLLGNRANGTTVTKEGVTEEIPF